MKTEYIFFSLVALLMLSACTKDEEVAITTVQINNLSVVSQYTRATFACDLVANSSIACVELQYSTDSLFGGGRYHAFNMTQNEHHYTANIESLQQGQTYYVRYKVHNSFNSMIPAQVDTFRTRAYTLPSVRTDSVTHITTHSADCYFTLTDWGCDSLPSVGVCCSTSLSDSIHFPYIIRLTDSTYICTLSNLTEGTTYSVCAYAKNAQGTAYSKKMIEFTTLFSAVLPTIVTSDVTAVSYTSAVCGGNITSDGHTEIIERGICYSTEAQPTIQDFVIQSGKGVGIFSCELSSLKESTTYYVCAFATNSKGTAYGEQKTFTTPNHRGPVFLIAADKYCIFSKGNLQYQVSTNTWSFAEHQYDVISKGTLADTIDLFAWSANNTTSPFGVRKFPDNADYAGDFVDWGTNRIGNDAPNTWRTLTSEEWAYLLQHTRWTMVRVDSLLGLMLLPDDFAVPTDLTITIIGDGNLPNDEFGISFNKSDYAQNQYTINEFNKLEAKGCVFLPCVGIMASYTDYVGFVSYVGKWAWYWSSSSYSDNAAIYGLNITDDYMSFGQQSGIGLGRCRGCSVRLVKNVK